MTENIDSRSEQLSLFENCSTCAHNWSSESRCMMAGHKLTIVDCYGHCIDYRSRDSLDDEIRTILFVDGKR